MSMIPAGVHQFAGHRECTCRIKTNHPLQFGRKFDHDDGRTSFYGILPIKAEADMNGIYTYDCIFDHVTINESKESSPVVSVNEYDDDSWKSWTEFCSQGEKV